jgi:glutathione reductase (NADPH)
MNRHFDLIAIGGGSGGLAVAKRAARYGRRVAVVESSKLGGTCVNNGCVPKKVMWYAAHLAHAVDDASGFGIPAQRGKTDWARLVDGRQDYIENINRYWDAYVDQLGVTQRLSFQVAGLAETKTGIALDLQTAGVDVQSNGIVPTDEF